MKNSICYKYVRDEQVSKEDFKWLGKSCATCVHCNSITGCEVTPRGKDVGDGRTYISLSGRTYIDDEW